MWLTNSVWVCSRALIFSFSILIVTSRSLTVVSRLTILVCVAFSSRFRKLILAASGDNKAVFALDFFRVEICGADDCFADVVVEEALILKVHMVFATVTGVVDTTLLGSEAVIHEGVAEDTIDGIDGSDELVQGEV